MSNVIDMSQKVEDSKKVEARGKVYDKAEMIERRMRRIKEYCFDGNKDAFVWSGIMMCYNLLDELHREADKLVDEKFDGGQIDDGECEG
jgi:hypothetical protein